MTIPGRFALLTWLAVAAPLFAQEPKPVEVERAALQVTVLGEVKRHSIPLGEVTTVFDTVMTASKGREGDLAKVLLLRPAGDAMLVVEVDVLHMIKTGDSKANVKIGDGDVVIVPNKKAPAADQEPFATLVPPDLAATLSERDRALVLAWCLGNTKDGKRLRDGIAELAKLGGLARIDSKSLVAKLGGEVTLAREAATALGMLGVGGRAALDDLRRCTSHEDVQLRERAKVAVRQIEKAIAADEATRSADKNEAGKSKE